jgi:hypothetical protein
MTQISDGTTWPPLINSVLVVRFCSEKSAYHVGDVSLDFDCFSAVAATIAVLYDWGEQDSTY